MHGDTLGFVRNIRIQFLNCCKCEFHLLVFVKQISKFGDYLEIILITLKAIDNLLAKRRERNKYSQTLGLLYSK